MAVAMGTDVDEKDLLEMARSAPSMPGRDLASSVSTREPYVVSPPGDARHRVAVLDLGVKRGILERLAARGIESVVVPITTEASSIELLGCDGLLLSNGPGDPEPLAGPTATVRSLLGRIPVFGICLGHQVLGRALGAETFKLPFGHHGGNHPVRRLEDGRVEVTSQNHGFAVDLWSLEGRSAPPRSGLAHPGLLPSRVDTDAGFVVPTHQNLNDGTLEGLACLDVPAFSVQYHPEGFPGPRDGDPLFDRFASLVEGDTRAPA